MAKFICKVFIFLIFGITCSAYWCGGKRMSVHQYCCKGKLLPKVQNGRNCSCCNNTRFDTSKYTCIVGKLHAIEQKPQDMHFDTSKDTCNEDEKLNAREQRPQGSSGGERAYMGRIQRMNDNMARLVGVSNETVKMLRKIYRLINKKLKLDKKKIRI